MLCDYTLVTNGCSFSKTIFPGLTQEQSLEYNWPQHLYKMLGCKKLENLAQGGGSNQRIHRTTFNRIISNKEDKIFLVIQCTELSRFEWCNSPLNEKLSLFEPPNTEFWKLGMINESDKNITEQQKNYLMSKVSVYSDIEEMYKLCAYLGNIKMLCDYNKIPYLVWFPRCWYNMFYGEIKFNKFLFNYLKYFIFDHGTEGQPEFPIISKNIDGHPNQDGHKVIAQKMFERIQEYGLLK